MIIIKAEKVDMFWNVRAYFYLDREANGGKGYKDCKFIIVEKQDANNKLYGKSAVSTAPYCSYS